MRSGRRRPPDRFSSGWASSCASRARPSRCSRDICVCVVGVDVCMYVCVCARA
jgi:hypothetical protein